MTTYKQKYNKKYGFEKDASHSLEGIHITTGIKKSILQDVFSRGVGAWKNNIESVRLKSGKKDAKAPRSAKMSKQQWSYARVYSFVVGGETQKTADADLWQKHLENKKKAKKTK